MKTYVEQLLNGEQPLQPVDLNDGLDARESFERHAARRLLLAYDLMQRSRLYRDDSLLALRDYLLVMNTRIRLEHIRIPDDNPYGIHRDADSGEYYAAYQLPAYVKDAGFVRDVFEHRQTQERGWEKKSNLTTDPLIERLTGYTHFKGLAQKLCVYGALNTPAGYTNLIALPTGGGKSLITQVMAYQQGGLTIVIVPTVSLAIDQVRNAKRVIRRAQVDQEIFYYAAGENAQPILTAIERGTARLLFISPETLMLNRQFDEAIQRANERRYLKNIIIDEAHIVVEWGSAFRVEYQCMESWRAKLLSTNPGIRTILLSATFEPRCVQILRTLFSAEGKWLEIRCDALRHEPRFILVNARSNSEKQQRMVELVQTLPHPMIIYTAKPDEAEEICAVLGDKGIRNVRTFTGRTTSQQRRRLIDDWIDDKFQIMVATSAFGVGVDKSDVRTVLHMYVPQNANAYYQELGRGGRDGLPCLSVMCIHNDDTDVAFQRISRRVLTVDKLMGRWDSMFNNPRSRRIGSLIYIDTSIKPNYSDDDELDDAPTSEADWNWNIYVLLFLRRYALLRVRDVVYDGAKYTFVVELSSELLLSGGDELRECLEGLRQQEWEYYYNAFENMRRSVRGRNRGCWSEMFFNTYNLVDSWCAGCRAHEEPEADSAMGFPLKRPVRAPLHPLEADQLALFGDSKELAILAPEGEWVRTVEKLMHLRLNVLVLPNAMQRVDFPAAPESERNLLILNRHDLESLMQEENLFFVSGLVAVIYAGGQNEILTMYRCAKAYLLRRSGIRVIHILSNDVWFERYDKKFTDWVDGKVLRGPDLGI